MHCGYDPMVALKVQISQRHNRILDQGLGDGL